MTLKLLMFSMYYQADFIFLVITFDLIFLKFYLCLFSVLHIIRTLVLRGKEICSMIPDVCYQFIVEDYEISSV